MLCMSFDFGTALIDYSLNLQHINGFVLAVDSALMPIPSHQIAHFNRKISIVLITLAVFKSD